MFQVIARTDTEVTVIFLKDSPILPGQIQTWTQDFYRYIGTTVSEFIPADGFTPFIDGSIVPIKASHAKCHNFAGGWNGYSFYADSKGSLYAVAK